MFYVCVKCVMCVLSVFQLCLQTLQLVNLKVNWRLLFLGLHINFDYKIGNDWIFVDINVSWISNDSFKTSDLQHTLKFYNIFFHYEE